jgi:hypothetical protein
MDALSLKSMYHKIMFDKNIGELLPLAKKERKELSMNKQKNQWEEQPLSQGELQEIEMVTGGISRPVESPTPIGPNKYLYGTWHPEGTVILHANDISIPSHTVEMIDKPPNTEWQHVLVPGPDGVVQHHYQQILRR